MIEKSYVKKADWIGIYSSGICLAHCIGFPFLLALLAIPENNFHWLDFVFLSVGFFAVFHSVRHQHKLWIKIALLFFISLLSISLLMEKSHTLSQWGIYLSTIGLIVTHTLSMFYCKNCK